MWAYIFAFLIFCLAMSAMAVGVMLRGRRIEGSCGGLQHFSGLGIGCAGCGKARRRCASVDKTESK